MLIVSRFGLFALVHRRGALVVRARVRADLEALRERADLRRSPIDDESGTDYPFRLYLNAGQARKLGRLLFDTVDYPDLEAALAPDVVALRGVAYSRAEEELAVLGQRPCWPGRPNEPTGRQRNPPRGKGTEAHARQRAGYD